MSRPSIFLSSTFRDKFGDAQRPIPLRTRILEMAATAPVDIWAYELVWGETQEELDADTIIDRCFAGIRACDVFVFILSGRHGSGTALVEGDETASSYLELELFAAAALGKPIVVLHYRNREPEPALIDTMLLLKHAFRSDQYYVADEQGLFERWNEIVEALAERRLPHLLPGNVLPEGLSRRRTRRDPNFDLTNPPLFFLGGNLKSARDKHDPDLGKAEFLLNQVAADNRSGRPIPHGAALFRLWSAMRELMDATGLSLQDPAIAGAWDRVLGLWAAKASWFGLHGHVWMGPLAAINSQMSLRRQTAFRQDGSLREPVGAKASAIYSIAQRMKTRERKFYHYRQATRLATIAIDQSGGVATGALSIRAHALMRMGRLGYLWKLWEAKHDFEIALRIREREHASESGIGEIKTDLGLSCVMTGQSRRGLQLLRDGIGGLRSDTSSNGKAFLARGLRKLELGARLSGKASLARDAHDERLRLAEGIEAMDQARPI